MSSLIQDIVKNSEKDQRKHVDKYMKCFSDFFVLLLRDIRQNVIVEVFPCLCVLIQQKNIHINVCTTPSPIVIFIETS